MANARRWFQLHLSTLVLITFVAGAFLYANTIPEAQPGFEQVQHYGWPWRFWTRLSQESPQALYTDKGELMVVKANIPGETVTLNKDGSETGTGRITKYGNFHPFRLTDLFLNGACALAIIASMAAAMEYAARRR